MTLVVVAAGSSACSCFNLNLGLSAFAAAALLLVLSAADEAAAIRGMPWGIIMMVSGVSVLDRRPREDRRDGSVHGSAGARWRRLPPSTASIAFVTGAISTYSSTSGVVLPAFLPTVPRLAPGGRRRSAGGRAVDQRRILARRRLAAVDARRALRGRRRRAGGRAGSFGAARLGPVDDAGRRAAVPVLRGLAGGRGTRVSLIWTARGHCEQRRHCAHVR